MATATDQGSSSAASHISEGTGQDASFFFIFSPLLPPGQDLCVGLDQTYQLLVCQVVSVLVNGLANKDDFEKKGRSKIQKRIPKTYPAEGLFDGSPRS